MNEPLPITIPLLNPNEPEALLADVNVREGQQVSADDLLCTLETTKSTAEVRAPEPGYVVGLRYSQGQTVRAGELLCYLAESPEVQLPAEETPPQESAGTGDLPSGLRITQPALALAKARGLDLNTLPTGPLVTESLVRERLQATTQQKFEAPHSEFDPTAIVVYGAGGHGKSLIDLLRTLSTYHIAGIIDDGIQTGTQIMGVTVLGGNEVLTGLYRQGVRLAVNAVGGIGNITIRIQVFRRLAEAGFTCPAVVHPTAFVEASARLAPGVQVFPHAYVGSQVRLGFGVIINTSSIVSHDCSIGDYANISPGAMLAGGVQVGRGVLIGMGATINLQVSIGSGARIGNGPTVKSDVPPQGIVRAGGIWPG
jgi:acetyltransferase EpsM